MLISDAWAQAATSGAAGASLTGTIIQMLAIVLVFYLLLIRPQQKKMKKHEEELKAIKVGDKIVTGGGLYAVVKAADGDNLSVEIAPNVEVMLYRYTVREVVDNIPNSLHAKAKETVKRNAENKNLKKQGKKNV